jgi:hypothetical protein
MSLGGVWGTLALHKEAIELLPDTGPGWGLPQPGLPLASVCQFRESVPPSSTSAMRGGRSPFESPQKLLYVSL